MNHSDIFRRSKYSEQHIKAILQVRNILIHTYKRLYRLTGNQHEMRTFNENNP